ncbi:hypothetical protein EOA30_36050 [Mesorhizobium sp. M8A.F.Ca.ET.059.01.1.1]|nr:hypothetical protein EOA30_36050 [Mesorhizobium sp. M8A.F.Ca.ET.059.01.1.1]
METTYHLSVFRHSTYLAGTPDVACRFAIEDSDWSGQREECESSGETHVTGIWGPAPLMLGLLKIIFGDAQSRRPTPPGWLGKAEWAIALGEAILEGACGPDELGDAP